MKPGITHLVRPDILTLTPYNPARSEPGSGLPIQLDANENPYPPHPAGPAEKGLNRYPEPQPAALLELLSELYGAHRGSILLTRGADEAIDVLVRTFCAAGTDGIVVCPPTFAMYATAARIQGAAVRTAPLADGFALDVDRVLAAHAEHPTTKLVFVCSPNNPTGNLMGRGDVLRLASQLAGQAVVVADELYLDYSGAPSLAAEIGSHPNLVVLRSASKEYSLAGERIGAAIAHPEVVGVLRRVLAPYPLAVSAVRSAVAALSPAGVRRGRANIARVVGERERVRAALEAAAGVVRVFPSDANFLLVRVRDVPALVAAAAAAGIAVRDRSRDVAGAVRVTVGTREENDAVLAVFRGV